MKLGIILPALVFVASGAVAQHAHGADASLAPTETGQAQFAAIAQIVAVLQDDPRTDWAAVDIDALRDHLVDMDNVTTRASAQRAVEDLTVTFAVSGDDAVARSIQRMVLAHSPMLQQATGWGVDAQETASGAVMVVQARTQNEFDQITGLGFFGVMTVGAHHQAHHLLIATGRSPH